MENVPDAMVNILDKTGSPHILSTESFQWMTSIEVLNPFFDWFCNSITEENFVTNDELRCYNHLMESGELLTEEELDLKIRNYLSCGPDAQEDETSVEGLREVVQIKEKVLNDLKKLKNCLYNELNKQERETCDPDIDKILQQEVGKMDQVLQQYMKQFRILIDKVNILYENIATLGSVVKNPVYICQQDLKRYSIANANLGLNIGILKKKVFEKKNSPTMETGLKLSISHDDFMNKLCNWMCLEEFNAGLYKSEIFILNEVIKNLSDCERNIEKSNFIFTWNDNKYFNNTFRPCSEEELKYTCELYVKDIIRGVQLNICKERLEKRKNRLSILEKFLNLVKTRKLCNESLHFLLMNEWKIIRTSVSLLQDIHECWEFNISESQKRMTWMKRHAIKQQMPRSLTDKATTEIENVFYSTLTLDSNASLQDINDKCIENLNKSIILHKDNITRDFEHFCIGIKRILSEVKKIDEFLFDKPTRMVHFNNDIIANTREIDRIVKSISLTDRIQEYEEHQVWLEKNSNLLHMMWYEWNKSPFAVIQSILKLEERATIQNRRRSMLVAQELSSVEFQEYSKF